MKHIDVTLMICGNSKPRHGCSDDMAALTVVKQAFGLTCGPHWTTIQSQLLNRNPIRFRVTSDQFAAFFILRRQGDVYSRLRWDDAVMFDPALPTRIYDCTPHG